MFIKLTRLLCVLGRWCIAIELAWKKDKTLFELAKFDLLGPKIIEIYKMTSIFRNTRKA